MFLFTLTASLGEAPLEDSVHRDLVERFPVSPPDGIRVAGSHQAAAAIGRWVVVARDERTKPSWEPTSGLLFAGDVRLYNRPELIAKLEAHGDYPDLELARLAYLRWGYACPGQLVGDFAFAAWDERRRSLFAARDHLGVRPLFYRASPRGVVVASDIRQILPSTDREVRAESILERLMGRVSDTSFTFFEGIRRLRAGHTLTVNADGVLETRHWTPDRIPENASSYAENCEQIRALFARAVRDRLESTRPVLAHSSGGFDSSTIVMAAKDVYRVDPERPPLVMVSGLARGYPSDESGLMDAVRESVPFESARWNIVEETTGDFPGVSLAGPILRIGPAGGPRGDLTMAHARGARVLLSGFLGDQVWYSAGVLRDLLRHGHLTAVLRHLARAHYGLATIRVFVDACLGFLPPTTASRLSERASARPEPPAWLGPRLLEIFPPSPEAIDFNAGSRSHLFSSLWAGFTRPRTTALVEEMAAYGVDDGVEIRLPHADVRLIEHVLSIPWWQREPKGHNRRTGREALGTLLPAQFATRVGQQPWTEVWRATAQRTMPSVVAYIHEGPWFSAPYVDRAVARSMLGSALARASELTFDRQFLLLQVAALEAWLRELFGYTSSREVSPCQRM